MRRALCLVGLLLVSCHHRYPDRPDFSPEEVPDLPAGREDLRRGEQRIDRGPLRDLKGSPCAGGAVIAWDLVPMVVVCQKPERVTQCQAAGLCNTSAGWSLCRKSRYRELSDGGKTPSLNLAWIAACAVDADWPSADITEDLCVQAGSECCQEQGCKELSPVGLARTCAGGPLQSTPFRAVGIVTAATCHEIKGEAALWAPAAASGHTLPPMGAFQAMGSLCCYDL